VVVARVTVFQPRATQQEKPYSRPQDSQGETVPDRRFVKSIEAPKHHAVSRKTVFAIQIGPAANRERAACPGSSPVNSRTTTLVSTAVMASKHLAPYRGIHLRERFRLPFERQTTRYFIPGPQARESRMYFGSTI